MQLYAWDRHRTLIHAASAEKQTDYLCCECGGIVRPRHGIQRQAHYYHLYPVDTCKQSGKSIEHLQVQQYLQSVLPQGEVFLEHRFEMIGRIADVVWMPHKLVFEIQCSPIPSVEVESRNRDYAQAGFEVIWILHDTTFNRRRVSGAELYLQKGHSYYTNIDQHGEGIIYDRQQKVPTRLSVEIKAPVQLPSLHYPPQEIVERLSHRRRCFKGDLVDRYAAGIVTVKEENASQPFLQKWIKRPYEVCLQIMLEMTCK